ncbi:MAG: hypothetical protein ACPGJS_06335 [Flammeovirgaceae bacterium]
MYFQFIDDSNPEAPKEIIIRADDITCIEKNRIPSGTTEDRKKAYLHVIILHTKSVISKKSNSIYLTFKEMEKRDSLYEKITSLLKPESFQVDWQLG